MKYRKIESTKWNFVSNPIHQNDYIPAERKVVLVWLKEKHLPFCGYIRYAAGDRNCPYFVVYHGNTEIGSDVLAWCDCLPDKGPDLPESRMFSKQQKKGRGFPKRKPCSKFTKDSFEVRK